MRQGRGDCKGASLITALMLGALALTLALTLAGMSFSHLTVSSRLSNISQARSLAEAVVSQGIERIITSKGKAFGPGEPVQTLTINDVLFPAAPGGIAKLTFDPAVAADQGVPLSTNNIKGETSKLGYGGRLVPEYSIHLVGLGKHHGVERKIEAIIHFPAYQFALSSKGQISSRGALVIAGADNPAQAAVPDPGPSGRDDPRWKQLLPGHVASNSSESRALDLIADSAIRVTGDLRAVGGITDDNVVLDGIERPNSESIDLPEIDLDDFDPANFGAPQGLPIGGVPDKNGDGLPDPYTLKGRVRHVGDVTFSELNLPSDSKGAVLWVDGDVTITGGLKGTGAIFATGDITIRNVSTGPTTLTSDNVCALVAGKKLTVQGAGDQGTSFFKGVVASGSDMLFSNVTVAGAAVSGVAERKGTDISSADPKLTLTNANVINIPSIIDFNFDLEIGTGVGSPGGSILEFASIPDDDAAASMTTDFVDAKTKHFYDAGQDKFVPGPGGWDAWDGFAAYEYDEATHTHTGSPWRFVANTGPLDQAALKARLRGFGDTRGPIQYKDEPTTYLNWADMRVRRFPGITTDDALIDKMIAEMADEIVHNPQKGLEHAMDDLNAFYTKNSTQPKAEAKFSMDPNKFVQWDSRTKIALWREL